jgi:leader peptidase (prepilin peptidase)/N-methyltransferase
MNTTWAAVLSVYAFITGSVVGSFLNMCIWRLPRRCLSVFRPLRSICPSCQKQIAWYDNIPIFSYISLAGRCRSCKGRISPRYMIVEILTGGIFAFLFYLRVLRPDDPQWATLFVHAALCSAIVAASFIDWEFMIIPDRISKPGMGIAPVVGLILPGIYGTALIALPGIFPLDLAKSVHLRGLCTSLLGMAVGAGVIYGMGIFGKALFRKEAMGFGDVKYMAMIGGILGWQGVAIAIVLACVFGSVIGIGRKIVTGDSYIPFGPFLGAGAICYMAEGGVMLRYVQFRFGEFSRLMLAQLPYGFVLAILFAACAGALVFLIRSARKR